jgi:cytochrome P450
MMVDHSIHPTDAAFFVRPDYFDVLASLRAEAPVHQWGPGFWTIARYEDIRDISRDPGHYCSGQGALVNDPIRGLVNPMSAPSLLHMDPPEHSSFRGLLNRRFTPRALSGLDESIRRCAVHALDHLEPHEEIDLVATATSPFPLAVIAELLGSATHRGRTWCRS